MRLAVNYSPQAARLLNEERIDLDLFKCPDWPDLIAEARIHRPVYIHFPLNAGDGSVANADWHLIESLLSSTATPYVNMHLIARSEDWPDIPVASQADEHLQAVAEHLIRDVRTVTNRFGADRVMVENVIYRGPTGAMLYAAIAPEVIAQVVQETGCGLLLDTAHAWITAHHLEIPAEKYIARLPVQHLKEMHVTGTGHDGNRWRDHMSMREEDFALVTWALDQIRAGAWAPPWAVSFEYGGIGPAFEWRSSADVLAAQVPRLLALVRG